MMTVTTVASEETEEQEAVAAAAVVEEDMEVDMMMIAEVVVAVAVVIGKKTGIDRPEDTKMTMGVEEAEADVEAMAAMDAEAMAAIDSMDVTVAMVVAMVMDLPLLVRVHTVDLHLCLRYGCSAIRRVKILINLIFIQPPVDERLDQARKVQQVQHIFV